MTMAHFNMADTWGSKRIIICCDGTGCNSYTHAQKSRATNVSRIMRYIRSVTSVGTQQIVLYIPGVGSDEANAQTQNLWNKALGIG